MTNCQVHNVRFYNLEPKSISCLAYCRESSKLALSRQDASIEIWDMAYAPHLEKTIQGTLDGSIEALAWSKGRLLSTGLGGFLIQWDLKLLQPKYSLAVTGNAAWCLDVNKTDSSIVIGTEQGYLNIYALSDDDIVYERILDRQEGRILCCKFNYTGEFIVTGSIDAIRIWNVKSGHAIHKMSTGRSHNNKETIVWCLEITEDFTIISGDSRGILTFWDGNLGAQIESLETHKADILSMCLAEDAQSFYCAGVDPSISHFTRIKVKKADSGYIYKWVRSVHRKIHEHDVRALVMCQGRVVSGGVDCYLTLSSYPPKTLHKYPPLLQRPCVTVATESRLVLLRYQTYMEIWRLGKGHDDTVTLSNSKNRTIPLEASPKKLLLMYSRDKESIVCCTLSQNGKWLAYATDNFFRFHKFTIKDDDKPTIERVDCNIPEFTWITRMEFTKDNSSIIVITRKMMIEIARMDRDGLNHIQSINITRVFNDLVHLITLSNDHLILGGLCGGVAVFARNKLEGSWVRQCKLATYHCPVTAVGVCKNASEKGEALVAVYCDHKIIEYDIQKKEYTEFSKLLSSKYPKEWLNRTTTIDHVTFDPRNKNLILLHDDTCISVIDKSRKFLVNDSKVLKTNDEAIPNGDMANAKHPFFNVIKKYKVLLDEVKHLVHLGWLSGNEMVAVEINPLTLIEQLPPPIYEKKFGCM